MLLSRQSYNIEHLSLKKMTMKKNLALSLFLLLQIQSSFGQTDSTFTITENVAQFPDGGQAGFYKYIAKNLHFVSPVDSAYQDCTFFIVSFNIEKDGKASDVRFRRGCSNPQFQRHVVELIEKMPLWQPATAKGQAVKMSFTMPFRIRLE